MIHIRVPGRGDYKIEYLVLDLNGTIALDGKILDGVREGLEKLSKNLHVTVVTADTNKNAESLLGSLPVSIITIREGQEKEQKLGVVLRKGKEKTVSIGNGDNDISMLKDSAIGICVLGHEGASPEAVMASDVVVTNINDAFDLLLKPQRLRASVRR